MDRESKEEEREDSRVEEASSVDRRENCSGYGREERTVGKSRGRERAQVTVGGDGVRSRVEGAGGTGSGLTECCGTAGPCEDKVQLVPGPVGGRRRVVCHLQESH